MGKVIQMVIDILLGMEIEQVTRTIIEKVMRTTGMVIGMVIWKVILMMMGINGDVEGDGDKYGNGDGDGNSDGDGNGDG